MNEIEKKALALLNEMQKVMGRTGSPWNSPTILNEALYRAIEQHEAYKQEVSDAVEKLNRHWQRYEPAKVDFHARFDRFIIPKPVDPLVEVAKEMRNIYCATEEAWAKAARTALASRGGRIVFDQPEGGAA